MSLISTTCPLHFSRNKDTVAATPLLCICVQFAPLLPVRAVALLALALWSPPGVASFEEREEGGCEEREEGGWLDFALIFDTLNTTSGHVSSLPATH
jgi:hypothetical protein